MLPLSQLQWCPSLEPHRAAQRGPGVASVTGWELLGAFPELYENEDWQRGLPQPPLAACCSPAAGTRAEQKPVGCPDAASTAPFLRRGAPCQHPSPGQLRVMSEGSLTRCRRVSATLGCQLRMRPRLCSPFLGLHGSQVPIRRAARGCAGPGVFSSSL